MPEDQTPNGGAAGDAGGAASGNTGDSTGKEQGDKKGEGDGGTGSTKTVSWDNHRRALDDMHKYKSQLSELQTKLGDIESNALKEKNDFKGLYERTKSELAETKTKLGETNNYFVKTLRSAEVKAAAVSAGLVSKSVDDLELLDLSDVQVEATSSGKFLVSGAKEFVDRLKVDRPHWFTKPTTPNVNGGGGGTPPPQTGPLKASDVFEAEQKWKLGKLSKAEYVSTYQKFVAQGK